MEIITHVCDICGKEIENFDAMTTPYIKTRSSLMFPEICYICWDRVSQVLRDEVNDIRFPQKPTPPETEEPNPEPTPPETEDVFRSMRELAKDVSENFKKGLAMGSPSERMT